MADDEKKKEIGNEKKHGLPHKSRTKPPPVVVNVTMPPELTSAIVETKDALAKIVANQETEQKARIARERSKAENSSNPVRTYEVGPRKSALWEILSLAAAVVLIVILYYGIRGTWEQMAQSTKLSQQKPGVTKADIVELGNKIVNSVGSLKDEVVTKNDELGAVRNDLKGKIDALQNTIEKIEKKQVVQVISDTPKIAAPENSVKVEVVNPLNKTFYNVLLLDNSGRIHRHLKGIRVSDIIEENGRRSFLYNGKPIYWTQKIIFSYPYTEGSSYTGAIYYTPEIAQGAADVINIPPGNVYQDVDGTIQYDDGEGNFKCAQIGAAYRTDQSTLPTQQ